MKSVVQKVISSRVEGIVLFNSELEEEDLMHFNHISLPVVLIGDDKFNLKNALVNIDYFTQIVSYIQSLDDTKIQQVYFLKDPNKDWHMINRFESAIRTGVKQKNLDLHILTIADSYDVIYEHFLREFRQPERWEDALIITTRDSLAIAINNAAMDLKLSIPQQVQTIGIIGTKNSRMARPSISIFDVDYYEIGSISTRMLTKLLNGTLENNRFNFSTHFIKRDSSRS
jgi:LacI family transcriptional regulator